MFIVLLSLLQLRKDRDRSKPTNTMTDDTAKNRTRQNNYSLVQVTLLSTLAMGVLAYALHLGGGLSYTERKDETSSERQLKLFSGDRSDGGSDDISEPSPVGNADETK